MMLAFPLRIALGALLLVVLAREGAAQAWTQPPGHTYLKLSYGAATASEQYAFDGRRKLYADDVYAPSFHDRSMYLYGEIGVLDGLTASFTLPYKRLSVHDTTFRYDAGALGDLEVGGRYRLPSFGGGAFAVNARLGLPLGYVRNTIPAPGSGQVNATLSLDYGKGFTGWLYAQAGLGYRLRSGYYGLSKTRPCQAGRDRGCTAPLAADLGDELITKLEVGLRPWRPVLVQVLTEAVVSVETPAVGFSAEQPIPTHQRYLKTGFGLIVDLYASTGVSVQGFFTPWGRNTVRSLDLFFGVHSAFDLWGT